MPKGYPRYGNTVIGPPGEWTTLRIAREQRGGEERYTGYTSRDDGPDLGARRHLDPRAGTKRADRAGRHWRGGVSGGLRLRPRS